MSETTTSQPAASTETPAATITTQATQATPAPTPEATPAQPAAQPAAQPTPEPVYTLTLPQDSLLDASAVERMTAFAKDGKLAPETAQKALEWTHAEILAHEQRKVADYKAKVDGWESTVKADKELGGENHTRTLTRVKAVLDRFGNPELTKAFQDTGFGNYPALVRFVDAVGAAMEADAIPKPGATPQPEGNYLDRMFPTSAGK